MSLAGRPETGLVSYDAILSLFNYNFPFRSCVVGRVLQHDGDGPRADGQAGPRASPGAAPRGVRAGVRALAGLPRHLRVLRLRAGQT